MHAFGILRFAALTATFLCLSSANLFAQRIGSGEDDVNRGTRAEITVNVADNGGRPLTSPVTVRIYRNGILLQQAGTAKGRASFILDGLGDYTIAVDAVGYKSSQKDVSIRVPIHDEEYFHLESDAAPGTVTSTPGKPLLAPKAQEALDKARQALRGEKLDEAEKSANEAAKLAPNNPDVLFIQGMVYLQRRDFSKAQGFLEKATQLDAANARALSALGMALANQNKYDQAIAPLEKSLQLDANAWDTEWALAKSYYYHEQFPEALKTSQKALADAHGGAPEIALLVAQCQTAAGQFEESAQTLRQYIKDHPDDPGAATAKKWLSRLTADGKIRAN
jgi:tetratricopeptide (TPR) repeat protein